MTSQYPWTYLEWSYGSSHAGVSDAVKDKHYDLMEGQVADELARYEADDDTPTPCYAHCEHAAVPQYQLDSDHITALLRG